MKLNKEVEQMKFRLSTLLLALVASSVTLWLIESPLKYALYFFKIAAILIVHGSLFGNLKTRNG